MKGRVAVAGISNEMEPCNNQRAGLVPGLVFPWDEMNKIANSQWILIYVPLTYLAF